MKAAGSVVRHVGSRGPAASPTAGDVNSDAAADARDVQLAVNAALGMTVPAGCDTDLNYSGATDAVDVQLAINAALSIKIDSDGDGLADAFERNYGTSPTLYDTDHDGVGDGQELVEGTDPLTPDEGR